MARETTAQAVKRLEESYKSAVAVNNAVIEDAVIKFEQIVAESVEKMADMVQQATKDTQQQNTVQKPEATHTTDDDGNTYLIVNQAGTDLLYGTFKGMQELIAVLMESN